MNLRRSVFTLIFAFLAAMPASAQVREVRLVEYSAKFLCGLIEPGPALTTASDPRARPGVYATSINIHNPQLPNFPGVVFLKKVALSSPEGTELIPPSPFRLDRLKPDFSEEVDCNIIRKMSGSTALFIEGYVVLIVGPVNFQPPLNELDVTGVYTVTGLPQVSGPSISLEIVPVTPRFIELPLAEANKVMQQMMEGVKKD